MITQVLCYLSGRRALKVLIVLKIGMLPAPEVKSDNRNKLNQRIVRKTRTMIICKDNENGDGHSDHEDYLRR